MSEEQIKETLEKQLQLLSERSDNADVEVLAELTTSMVNIAKLLIY